jgi:HPt (histidine-containing phosphotransfer) domain-containing protein
MEVVMDISKLAGNLGLENDEFIELAELFVETGSSDLERLKISVENEDMQGVVESAHSIKGASGNLGFSEIYEIAKKVELNARSDSLEGAGGAVLSIREKIEQLSKEISDIN